MEILKVAAKSNPKSVAGAIASLIEKNEKVALHAVGAAAINQAVKAIAIARGFIAAHGIDLITIIGFAKVIIDGNEKTAMKFIVEPR